MSKFLDLHGWKAVTLVSAFMLSCSIAVSTWIATAKPRPKPYTPLSHQQLAESVLEQRRRTFIERESYNDDLRRIAAGADVDAVQAERAAKSAKLWEPLTKAKTQARAE